MSAGSSENPVVKTRGPCSPRTGDHLSGGCHARWPFFVVLVVLMASAPSVLLQPDQEVRTGRWPRYRRMWCSKLSSTPIDVLVLSAISLES
jgi:hypothetical protein